MKHSHKNGPSAVLRVLARPEVYLYFIVPLLFMGIFAVFLGQFVYRTSEYAGIDLIINLLLPRTFSLLFVFLWTVLTAVLLLRDFDSAIVIRYRSRRGLWMAQVQKIVLLCLVYALFLTAALAVVGSVVCETPVNFTSKDSTFFLATGKVMPENPPFGVVLLVFFLTVLLPMIAMCLLAQLSKWILNNPVFGIIGVIAVSLTTWLPHTERIAGPVHPLRIPSYDKWLDIPGIFLSLLIPLGWVAGLVFIGLIVSKRRDFLNVQQK